MAYNKNTWQTGDVVTAAKLNNMENGISRLPYSDFEIVNFVYDDETDEYSCDHTYDEIVNLDNNDVHYIAVLDSLIYQPKMGGMGMFCALETTNVSNGNMAITWFVITITQNNEITVQAEEYLIAVTQA